MNVIWFPHVVCVVCIIYGIMGLSLDLSHRLLLSSVFVVCASVSNLVRWKYHILQTSRQQVQYHCVWSFRYCYQPISL